MFAGDALCASDTQFNAFQIMARACIALNRELQNVGYRHWQCVASLACVDALAVV